MENDCINGKRKHSTINSIKIQKWTKKLFVCDVICRRTHVQCHSKSGSAFQIGSKKSLKTLKIFEWIAIDYTSSAHNKSNNNSLSIITFLWVITIRPTSHFQYFAINILIIKNISKMLVVCKFSSTFSNYRLLRKVSLSSDCLSKILLVWCRPIAT